MFCPENSSRPLIRLKNRLPKLKMSDFSENLVPFKTSGSTYPGVPHLILRLFESLSLQARPKSAKQTCNYSLFNIRIFSGLMSLCKIYFLCMKSTARIS
jgi:hypothetical protein